MVGRPGWPRCSARPSAGERGHAAPVDSADPATVRGRPKGVKPAVAERGDAGGTRAVHPVENCLLPGSPPC
jgi:hypothetical protein